MKSRFARLLPLLLVAASLVSAQSHTIFDEIQDAGERTAFREVWDTHEPARQKGLALRFVELYPRSILLKEAYELAARAFVATGDYAGGLYWAKRSLRLMPENPFLLVMVAGVAATQSQLDLAETSARSALRYLSNAYAPDPISTREWPRVRSRMRATANLVLGRVAAAREQYNDAERLVLLALSQNPDDMEALYVLGIVRMARHDDGHAAPPLARVMKNNGMLSSQARQALRQLQARAPGPSVMSVDEYAARLQWIPPGPVPEKASGPVTDRYAGSAACRDCHRRQYNSWQSTGMSKMFRPYRASDVIGDFSGRQTVAGSARAVLDGGRHFMEIRKGEGTEWIRYPVDFIIGSKWQQAYATKLADGRILVFPIQYSRRQAAWVNYWEIVDVRGTPRTEISRFHEIPDEAVYQNTCASCHTSQLKFVNGPGTPGTAAYREGGVNCEMCHGPSLGHVESMKAPAAAARSATATPLDFARLTAEQSVAICAQCHSQSAVHDAQPGGAANYSDEGPAFYRTYASHLPSDFSRSAFYRDGRHRATTFIAEAFSRSQCFLKGGATCASCHDPHPVDTTDNPTSLKFGADSDRMCVQCHRQIGDNPQPHTRHAAGTEASRCVSCHMPRIMDALLFPARSHEIDDIPDAAMTARFGQDDSPNACLACHADRTIDWLQTELAKWPRR